MATNITPPPTTRPIVIDGEQTQELRTWTQDVTSRINDIMIVGTGTPEGIIFANQGQLYLDDSGTPPLYVKQTGDNDVATGWVQV